MKKITVAKILTVFMMIQMFAAVSVPIATAANEINTLIGEQLEPVEEVYSPNNPVTEKTLAESVARIIRAVLGFLGIIFLVLMIYAGFTWMTAAGNEEKVSTAKKIMVAAVIGAAIVLSAYAITYFVIDQLLVATKGEGLN